MSRMEGSIYCPKCDRSIRKVDLEERRRILRDVFDNKSIDEGRCPVCGAPMLDMDKVAEQKEKMKE